MIFQSLEVLAISFGIFFIFLAAIGCLKFPDLYTRMAAGSKATTMGLLGMLIGVMFSEHAVGFRFNLGLSILFFLFVAPTAAHLLGRAAYKAGVKPWANTQRDDWSDE